MRSIKHGVVAVALAAVLASCSEDTPSGSDAEKPATGAPTTEAAAECQTLAGSDHAALTPGCWAIQFAGLSGSPRAELNLPAGFYGSDFGVWKNPTNPKEAGWGTISLRTGGDVYPDPCKGTGNPPTVGPTVEDLTSALTAQKVTDTTAPVPVEVDGHVGLYVEVSVPAAFDISGCRNQELLVWQEPGGEPVGIDREYMSRYWVLDVDGQRVVLVVNTHPKATEETVELFSGIVESAALAEG
jgi:hypothetical protein